MVAQNIEPQILDTDPAAEPEADEGHLDPEATRFPHFVALSFDGEYVDADEDLDALLARLVAAIDPRDKEELCIWERGECIVAVVRSNGSVVRLDTPTPTIETHQLASGKRSRRGRPEPPPASEIAQPRRNGTLDCDCNATGRRRPFVGCSGSAGKRPARCRKHPTGRSKYVPQEEQMNPTPVSSQKPQQPRHSPEAIRRALAVLGPKWECLERLPHLLKITEVACGARMARDSIHELMDMSATREGVMDPDEEDGITWEDFDYEMGAWLWALDHAIDFLQANFTDDVEKAWFQSGAMTAGEKAAYEVAHAKEFEEFLAQIDAAKGEETPPDAPIVAELPPAKGKPYWLSTEGQP